jgi:hypothetical protein
MSQWHSGKIDHSVDLATRGLRFVAELLIQISCTDQFLLAVAAAGSLAGSRHGIRQERIVRSGKSGSLDPARADR